MRKMLIVLIMLTVLPLSATCGNTQEGLIFNTPEVAGFMNFSPAPHAFWLGLTDAQLDAIFPTLDLHLTGRAYFSRDGEFAELDTTMPLSDMARHELQILVGAGRVRHIFSDYFFEDDFVPQISYVYGIPVTLLMFEIPRSWGNQYYFRADFVIGNIVFHARFWHENAADGQALMTNVVNGLILGGTQWLDVFANPDIPELRAESLTFEEALKDADFGAFMPTNIPDGFESLYGAHRSVRGHVGENSMSISWESSIDYDYLYEIYTNWVETQDADAIVFPFERIFWGEPSVRWIISKVREFELERLVSVDDHRKYDWSLYPSVVHPGFDLPRRDIPYEYFHHVFDPVFLAEEFTLDVLRAREELRHIPIQAAYPDNVPDDFMIHLTRNFIRFGILFDDVLVRIDAQGLTYEQIWVMLKGLIEN
ncbi:MAG: hypothetical protein FWC76_02600 [Defluviitaleaceae bacterium]|nr:hypothetical protein [Defluviitaleaceae bacterium]